ncbi:MAG TPA: zinc ribbon domain-containing protein [Anaerolineae bacterium]
MIRDDVVHTLRFTFYVLRFYPMTTGSILLGLALLILVALFLARPFLRRPVAGERRRSASYQTLLARKEALLQQIRELDFDHETGKIPNELYQPQRMQLVSQAAALLQQLDEMAVKTGPAASPDVDAQIEAAVARLRTRPSPAATASNGSGGYCPQCGRPTDAGDKFCAACGHKLPAIQTAKG